jgi:hypothetical protein
VRFYWQGTARVSNLQDGNNDRDFRVEARMGAAANAGSPAASILPIITVAHPLPAAHFFIPSADVEGDPLTWTIAPTGRSLLFKAAPDGSPNGPTTLSIDSRTGEVTWNTAAEAPPLPGGSFFAVQFLVSDGKGGETAVDALLRLVPNSGAAPVATINGSTSDYVVAVHPNEAVSFTLTGTDTDTGATVTLTSGNMPTGSTMSPTLPDSGSSPRSSVFNWTPTLGQAGNVFPVSFAVTDDLGIQDGIAALITVLANMAPAVSCPAPVSVEATGPRPDAATVSIEATVDDPEGDALTVRWYVDGVVVHTDLVPASPDPTTLTFERPYDLGAHPIKVEADDGHLVEDCESSVTVVDTTPPDINDMPANIVKEATGPLTPASWDSPTAVDIVDGVRPVTCDPVSGSTFPLGTTVVTCKASDLSGNESDETFTVTVQDTTPPDINDMPANIVKEALGPSGAPASWDSPTAIDLVDGPRPVGCAPISGSTFPLGTTTVTCSASDLSGNSSSETFTVKVQDTTPPTIHNMPADITVPSTSPAGAVVTWDPPNATDLVDITVPVFCVPPSGSLFPIGPTLVKCTATDAAGNAASKTFTVTVIDATPPGVVVALNPGKLWPPNHKMVRITVTVTTDPDATCAITAVTSNEPINGTGDGDTAPDWIFKGMQLQLRAERSGTSETTVGRIYTVTVSCTDSDGNTGTGTATANVPHDMRPSSRF